MSCCWPKCWSLSRTLLHHRQTAPAVTLMQLKGFAKHFQKERAANKASSGRATWRGQVIEGN